MSKKQFGKFLATTALISAAVAGCVIYFTKYKDFQKSLDEDFNDFEEEPEASFEDEDVPSKHKDETMKREYVSIPLEAPENTANETTSSTTEK